MKTFVIILPNIKQRKVAHVKTLGNMKEINIKVALILLIHQHLGVLYRKNNVAILKEKIGVMMILILVILMAKTEICSVILSLMADIYVYILCSKL